MSHSQSVLQITQTFIHSYSVQDWTGLYWQYIYYLGKCHYQFILHVELPSGLLHYARMTAG